MALAAALTAPAAHARVYSDIIDWNMCDSAVQANAGGYTTASDNTNGAVDYRWLDTTTVTTVISINSYYTGDMYDKVAIPAGVTTYSLVGYRYSAGALFRLYGRTQIGSGCMYGRDGRVLR